MPVESVPTVVTGPVVAHTAAVLELDFAAAHTAAVFVLDLVAVHTAAVIVLDPVAVHMAIVPEVEIAMAAVRTAGSVVLGAVAAFGWATGLAPEMFLELSESVAVPVDLAFGHHLKPLVRTTFQLVVRPVYLAPH